MFTALIIAQVLLGLSIITLVLLQQGKGADMGAAFGAGASGSVFGSRGSGSFLSRATAVLATLFFINSVLLSSPIVMDRGSADVSVTGSVTNDVPVAAETDEVPPVEEVIVEETVEVPSDDLPSDLPSVDDGVPGSDSDLPE